MTVTAMPIEPDRHLAALARLAEAIPHEGWFSACGDPLIAAEREEARLYLDGLGFADTRVQAVPDWVAARAVAERPDWDPRWWDAEEAARADLLAAAEAALPERALYDALSRVTEAAGDTVHGKAAVAAARAGVADPGLIRSAAGAAAMACYQHALTLAARRGDDHPFAAKYRLFTAGRWPLAIGGEVFSIL